MQRQGNELRVEMFRHKSAPCTHTLALPSRAL
jgi:hypothetical protein